MPAQDDKHNIEFMEHILRDWAEKMWIKNNPDKITDKWGGSENFINYWLDGHEQWLTGRQRASEMGFVAYAQTLVYTVGFVSKKAVDALADNKLVNAWRKSVQKNSFQKRYNKLEEILQDTIKKNGKAAAAAMFPEMRAGSPEEIAASLEYMNYTAKFMPLTDVVSIIRASGEQPSAPAPKAAPEAP